MRLTLVVLAILVILYLQYLTQVVGEQYYTNRIDNNKTNPKVYDILHKYLPDYSNSTLIKFVSDCLPICMLLYAVYSTEQYSEIFYTMLVMLFIRSVCILCTILPSQRDCKSTVTHGCYDKLYSGHFATGLVATLICLKYGTMSNAVFYSLNILNAALIMVLRAHYTNDILMALFATLSIHKLLIPAILS